MRPTRTPRERAERILRNLRKTYPHFNLKKTRTEDGLIVTLPRKEVRVPVSSKLERDLSTTETILNLAQKFATVMVRETIDSVVDSIITRVSDNLVKELLEKMPSQRVVIEQVAGEVVEKTKKSFQVDDEIYIPVNYQSGLELVGAKERSVSRDAGDMDAILKQLAGLDSTKK